MIKESKFAIIHNPVIRPKLDSPVIPRKLTQEDIDRVWPGEKLKEAQHDTKPTNTPE